MLKRFLFALALLSSIVIQAPAWATDDVELFGSLLHQLYHQDQVAQLSIAEIFLEQNSTDGDTEVVVTATGGDEGLKRFWLFAPDGKLVYEFKSPKNGRNIGGREIIIESPESPDIQKTLVAYPKGIYVFIAESVSGQWLYGTAKLSHKMPAPVVITSPIPDSYVSRHALTITWSPVVGAASYIVELQNKANGRKLTVDVPGNQTTFQAPAEWVVPGTEYQVGVFVINNVGNKVTTELTFLTVQD
ncbi:MAG: fibronectin type III domain-containing protein [Gammaproteobacteria bacterium]|nr:fibronectin type III domain-containing protein [Gammaproteobacteria bacterium]